MPSQLTLLHPLHPLHPPLLHLQKHLRSNSGQSKKTPQCGVFFRLDFRFI
jgi:hypothetical protein